MPVPMCHLTSPYDTSVVTFVPSSSECAVTFAAMSHLVSAAPFVPPSDVVLAEPSHKRRRRISLRR